MRNQPWQFDMKKILKPVLLAVISVTSFACSSGEKKTVVEETAFEVKVDQFADLQILRYRIPGFDSLSLQQKELLYYLSEAAKAGRDMIWDQNYKYNLVVRRTLEQIVMHYEGDKNSPDYAKFMEYTKRVWFSNGIHHHYSTKKIMPEFTADYFASLITASPKATFPVFESVTDAATLVGFLNPILFDPNVAAKRVNQDADIDNVVASANNFYEGVTQAEVKAYYAKLKDKNDKTPIWHGLNSKMVKENGQLVEKVWKSGGMYGAAIDKIIYWLEKASGVAENEKQKAALDLLIDYYKTGDLKTWDAYNIAWVADTESMIDVVNGFIEVYGDALGMRASYESVVSVRDMEATKRIKAIGDEAQWFEDNSPLDPAHKKEKVTGISAKVILAVQESGDAAPATPIGINLPNSDWIRKDVGSKSVSLGNIVGAYDEVASKGSSIEEFAFSQEEIDRSRKYGALAGALHTDMHEVIGHASGKLNANVGTPKETLIQYASTLEEARADLVALYYLMDEKLIQIGVMPSLEVGKAEYDSYIRNGLMLQLRRIDAGDNLEESHMRNRQLNAAWAMERGKADNVIERKVKDGKTYFVVNDYQKLRVIFGELLREIQRIKSEGDFKAGQALVENYGVKVDQALLTEVKERFQKIQSAPYSGFIQPKLTLVKEGDKVVDVKVSYPSNFVEQMMEFGKENSHLPHIN